MVTLVSLLGLGCSTNTQRKLHREIYKETGEHLISIDISRKGIGNIADYTDAIYKEVSGKTKGLPGRVSFLGYSLGGAMAFEMARLMPEKIKEIFAVAPLSDNPYTLKDFIYKGLALGKEEAFHPLLIGEIARNLLRHPRASTKLIEDIAKYKMPKVEIPTTIIFLENDRFFQKENFNVSLIPDPKNIHQVPGNHLSCLINPTPTVDIIAKK